MNRREFLLSTALAGTLARIPRAWAQSHLPEIAFTFDDPTTDGGANLKWTEVNERMLAALSHNNIKSILFVVGKRIDSGSGRQLITAWDRAGHLIGNHSYSHMYFNVSTDTDPDGFKKVTLAEFEADALKNEPLILPYRNFTRLFRYPYFKEGDTVEKRDGMRAFLQEHGYRIGRATIDASDWGNQCPAREAG